MSVILISGFPVMGLRRFGARRSAPVTGDGCASLALHGDGRRRISLDSVIAAMRQTGADMQSRCKETSLGGLL